MNIELNLSDTESLILFMIIIGAVAVSIWDIYNNWKYRKTVDSCMTVCNRALKHLQEKTGQLSRAIEPAAALSELLTLMDSRLIDVNGDKVHVIVVSQEDEKKIREIKRKFAESRNEPA